MKTVRGEKIKIYKFELKWSNGGSTYDEGGVKG
jgi:hypothetical protein